MKRKFAIGFKVFIGIVFALILGYLILKFSNISLFQKNTSITSSSLKEQLIGINEISSVEYNYTNVGTFSDDAEIFGQKIPLLSKKFILIYDGKIKAGVNMAKAEVSVKGKMIEITLPKAEILSHEIFEDSVQVYDESSSIFNPLKLEDFTKFRSTQKDVVEEKAKTRLLLEEASANAEKTIRSFITALPGKEDYTVEFVHQ